MWWRQGETTESQLAPTHQGLNKWHEFAKSNLSPDVTHNRDCSFSKLHENTFQRKTVSWKHFGTSFFMRVWNLWKQDDIYSKKQKWAENSFQSQLCFTKKVLKWNTLIEDNIVMALFERSGKNKLGHVQGPSSSAASNYRWRNNTIVRSNRKVGNCCHCVTIAQSREGRKHPFKHNVSSFQIFFFDKKI